MAGWKATLDASEKSYVIHRTDNHVDASIGASPTSAVTFYSYIDVVGGDNPPMDDLAEDQVTERLITNNIDPDDANWK